MGWLIVLLYVAEVVIALLLIGIVLIQQSKSQGGLGALSGGMTESIFGASTGNVVTRTTVVLATVFLVNTLLLAILTGRGGEAGTRAEELAKGAQTEETQPRTASEVTDAVVEDIEEAVEPILDPDESQADESAPAPPTLDDALQDDDLRETPPAAE